MKRLNTTIKLSVLALACLGVGVMTLQPTAFAKAEGSYDAKGLTMENGAAVALTESFSGIRWKTTIDAEWYNNLPLGSEVGVIVLPTSKLGADGELTHADGEQVLELKYGIKSDDLNEDTEFYSVVNYNDIWENYKAKYEENGQELPKTEEQVLAESYALELTARAYAKVEGTYYYVDWADVNTSRSARQVAIAAELAGEIDQKYREVEENAHLAKNAEAYYGMSEKYTPAVKSTGAIGTTVIDLENPTATVTASIAIEGNFQEAIIGAKKVAATYADGTLTITDANGIPTGEKYITVFTDSGVYTTPVIGATKVLKQATDLTLFNAKGVNGVKSTKIQETTDDDGDGEKETLHNYYEEGYWSPEQEQSGYYVLGNNIEAEGYVHGSKKTDGSFNDNTWNSATDYYKMPIGLTGTFNGMGFAIKDMEIGSQREGFFGIVNGGTVKNVAFLDVKATGNYKLVIANYLLNATIENVFVTTDKYVKGESKGFTAASGAILAEYAATEGKGEQSLVKNCSFVFNTPNKMSTDAAHGFLFRTHNAGNFDVKYENVYLASENNFNYNYTDGETTAKENVRQRLMYDAKNKIVYLAENEAVQNGTDEDGNPIWNPASTGKGIYPVANFVSRLGLKYNVLVGVNRYKNLNNLKAIPAAVEWMPEAWLA